MDKQHELFKGELMEEQLRSYFLGLGYYVVRGIKYKYQNIDLTDVDLFLYKRNSSLTRERINVDIKNKKTPQAFERILWANGIMKLLGFDSCIVATRDSRPVIHSFGQRHKTLILDGAFLSKLPDPKLSERMSEEDILKELSKYFGNKKYENKDWRHIYELSKSRLLSEQDFSGFNATLFNLVYFLEACMTDSRKREIATRMLYANLSHLLITMDFILKDLAFLDPKERERRLSEGLTFGNLGKEGVSKIIAIAVQISGNRSADSYLNSLRTIPIEMLTDFFSRAENFNNLFSWARDFEGIAYKRSFVDPNKLEGHLKGTLSLILDYTEIDRKTFFSKYSEINRICSNTLKIISAIYGTPKNSIDITNELSQRIKDNQLEIVVNNDIAGDPDYGAVKDFKIVYELNGEKQTRQFKEGEKVLILGG